MHESTEHERKRDGGPTPILSALPCPVTSRRLPAAPPRIEPARVVMVPEPAPAPPLAASVRRPMQYRLEILDSVTDGEVDAFVESGFAEDSSFEMRSDGLWRQPRLEADVPNDGDEG